MSREKGKGKKRVRRLGPFKYSVYSKAGKKQRRLLFSDKMIFGFNDYEKPHGEKPGRGRHLHIPLPGGRELKVYLDGRRPVIEVKESRSARRRREKKRGARCRRA